MRVLKDGKYGKVWKAKVTCKKRDSDDSEEGCGAKLEVEESDLVLLYWEGTHFTHHYCGVRCPQCGHVSKVSNVPKLVWQRVNTTANRRKATFDGFSESLW